MGRVRHRAARGDDANMSVELSGHVRAAEYAAEYAEEHQRRRWRALGVGLE